MRIAGSNRYYLGVREKQTLARMARRNVEEGEISDGDSIEEISAEDFKHEGHRGSSKSRVWMSDLMRYPPALSRNLAPNLHSFAWAQAVQNKPLLSPVQKDAATEEDVVAMVEDGVVIEEAAEKEEGELEEGEIELGSDSVAANALTNSPLNKPEDESEPMESADKESEEIGEFDRRVSLILEELDAVTKEEAEASFDAVCGRLRKSFENLKQMFSESRVPVLDTLVQQAFEGMQTVHSVASSSNLKKNEDLLLRLLIHIKNQYSSLLTAEQLKELDSMVQSLLLCDNKGDNMNGFSSHGMVSSEKTFVELKAGNSAVSNTGKAGLPKLETLNMARNRVEFSPLLDLHADYDEGSLPSPTREIAPPLPMPKPIGFGIGAVMASQPMPAKNVEAEADAFQPYDTTDAFKAVSSYQQKYSMPSFIAINRFPSPTPSEECDGNDDILGEVSSAQVFDNVKAVNSSSPLQLLGSSSSGAFTASSSGFQTAPVKTVRQLGFGPNPAVKAPAKSRDPRLRILNPEVVSTSGPNRRPMPVDFNTPNGLADDLMNSRKHKAVDEPMLDGHTLKRQRNGPASSRAVHMTPGRGGWLEESNAATSRPSNRNVAVEIRKPGDGEIIPNRTQDATSNFDVINGGIGQNSSTSSAPAVSMSAAPLVSTSIVPAVSLPSLLKDIAVNPTMLMQLIQMEQQRLAAQAQQKTAESSHNSTLISTAVKLPGTIAVTNVASLKPSEIEQNPEGKAQLPAQTVPTNAQNDVGRIRMKPRDPRRILHNNMVQKSESSKSEQTRINGILTSDSLSSKDRLTVREQGEEAQTTGLPSQPASQPASQPDIARLFTKNLKNLADMVSSSQVTNTSPTVPQNTSQPVPNKINKVDTKPPTAEFDGQKAVSGLPSEGGTGASQTQNPWGDVEYLLDGYDDQQKAAIQRERSRRIEEQNKMFAAKKLCLVLDLDHTLLNSAKFIEVDPIHDEILRKKEEQDREKPQRHLYRFQHMGMWTKLRPGIWNFLERASKLYELHLYTMGNKLYATEMAKVLDPTGNLFAGRVISRGDDSDPLDGDDRAPKSKDLDGVLGMESAVVIIDDSVRVWPHNKLNLIVVERYTYFPCSRRQFGLPGPSLLEIDHDERPEAGTLASSLVVIERIHQNFFSHRMLNDVDVRNILAAEQRKILAGCRIVFSRIFPVGEANPHMHPLWQTAEQFGAVCTNQIDEQVTHVVASSLGTDKVNWALSTGRFVVQPGWVEASALLYRRANELDFAVKI